MFTVTGTDPQGVGYHVAIGEQGTYGLAAGSANALNLLIEHDGQELDVTPTGPVVLVDRSDPESLLGALYALTRVSKVAGDDIPGVFPPAEPDVVY